MGVLLETLQNSVTKSGRDAPANYTTQPFLLTLEFIGFGSGGERVNTGETRHIPIRLTNIEFEVTAGGSVYDCRAIAYNEFALSDEVQSIPEDVKLNGSTIAEVLQTSNNSLTTLLNQKQLELKNSGNKKSANVYIISFPMQGSSFSNNSDSADLGATTMSNTDNSVSTGDNSNFDLSAMQARANDEGSTNSIGSAKLRNLPSDSGNRNTEPQDQIDKAVKENGSGPEDNQLNFQKNQRIQDIIEHLVTNSEYGKKLAEEKPDSKGYLPYWRIEPEVYEVIDPENIKQRGAYAKVFHFKVVEYKVHSSHVTGQGKVPPGVDILRKKIPKEYNYIYTGQNDDIIDFNIQFNSAFIHGAQYDAYQNSRDQNSAQGKAATGEDSPNSGVQDASRDADEDESDTDIVDRPSDNTSTGAGDLDIDSAARITREFNEIITNGIDLITAEMDILGDPYFIADSGIGNYSAGRAGRQTTTDGSIDYQFEEACCILNFRTPIDFSAQTGEYIFTTDGTTPVRKFSGVYRINTITNTISGNKFTQKLDMHRMRNQNGTESSQQNILNVDSGEELEEALQQNFSSNIDSFGIIGNIV